MGMNVGGNGQKANINVTPMIDVLLVLIIIFLVISPSRSHGLNAVVPPQSDKPQTNEQASHEIVITIAKDGVIAINQQPVTMEALPDQLGKLRGISDQVFVKGDRDLDFQAVAQIIDIALGAGWKRIGLMTR